VVFKQFFGRTMLIINCYDTQVTKKTFRSRLFKII